MSLPRWATEVETSRCTGHCCDPVCLPTSPGDLRRLSLLGRLCPSDAVLPEMLVWLRWRPPTQGGWVGRGNHEYRCKHFDQQRRVCRIYHKPRPRMCTGYPRYKDGGTCSHPGCTRRVKPADKLALRVLEGLE